MDAIVFIITVTVVILWLMLLYKYYKKKSLVNFSAISLNQKTDAILKAEAKRIEKRNSTAKFLANLRKLAFSNSLFNESDRKMDTLKYYAKRLNFVLDDNILTYEDLFAIRALCQFIYIIVICILVIFITFYLSPLLVFYRFPALIIDFMCEQEIKTRNETLLKDFRDFYAEFFFNYRHKANRGVKITEVAMRFYNRANPETKLLIDNLRADAVVSEEYALDQMKDLFRVVKIHRLADQVKMIIMGKTLNTDAMEGFKQEIEAEFRAEKRKKLEITKTKANATQIVAWVILTELVMTFSVMAMMSQ